MQQQELIELIKLSKNNNTNAFRKLVEAHQGLVYSLAFRLITNADDANDITQETFIKVWKNLHRFDISLKFSTWLYKIATNLCYDKLRSLKRQKNMISINISDFKTLNLPSDENIDAELIKRELSQIIIALTEELSPKQKLVFTLSDIEGLEVDEIEEITGLSAGKIKSNLYLARQFIRKKISHFQ